MAPTHQTIFFSVSSGYCDTIALTVTFFRHKIYANSLLICSVCICDRLFSLDLQSSFCTVLSPYKNNNMSATNTVRLPDARWADGRLHNLQSFAGTAPLTIHTVSVILHGNIDCDSLIVTLYQCLRVVFAIVPLRTLCLRQD